MTAGVITTTQIDNDTQTFIAAMLETHEHKGVMDNLTDVKTLPRGYGLTYNEPYVGALTAATLTDGVEFDSPSTFTDTNVTVTITEYGVQTLITELSNDQVKENLFGIAGRLMGNAMAYQRDTTGLTQLDSFNGSIGSGTAAPVIGHITAAQETILAGLPQSGAALRTGARSTGDPAEGAIHCVLHGYQVRAIRAQLSTLTTGSSDGAFATGTAAAMNLGLNRAGNSETAMKWLANHAVTDFGTGVMVYRDNNLTIASNAAKGAVFNHDALIHLRYRTPNDYNVRTQDGRARKLTLSDTWGWGIRAHVWGVELNLDAHIPTT